MANSANANHKAEELFAVAIEHYLSIGDVDRATEVAEKCAELGSLLARGPGCCVTDRGYRLINRALRFYNALLAGEDASADLLDDAANASARLVTAAPMSPTPFERTACRSPALLSRPSTVRKICMTRLPTE